MLPAGDKHDLLSSLSQSSAKIATYATCAKDYDTHGKPPPHKNFIAALFQSVNA
jgi:hypothetical protein